jgi:hypothetical protein
VLSQVSIVLAIGSGAQAQGLSKKDIDSEQALVESNRKRLERFERKIQEKLAKIWGSASAGSSNE